MENNNSIKSLKEDVNAKVLSARPIVEKEKDILNSNEHSIDILNAEELVVLFNNKNFGKKNVVISFSHDDYVNNNGGIQKCIFIEEKKANEIGDDYLHIFPVIPRTWIVDDELSGTIPLGLNLNGQRVAKTNCVEFVRALQKIAPDIVSTIVHSPLGHSLIDILNIAKCSKKKTVWYYWLHDFTTLCPSFNLLRNDVVYCGLPANASKQCEYCYAGLDRKAQKESFSTFFKKTKPIVISPSDFMKNFWANNVDYSYSKIKTIEHYSFGKDEFAKIDSQEKIKIAFLGTPAYHKGWNDFIELIEAFQTEDSPFSFYVFSKEIKPSDAYQHVEVVSNADKDSSMREKLIEYEIDISFLGSIWPETFCLTAYEAFAADAFLVANYLSGNVVNFLKQKKVGYIYRGVKDLINYLQDDAVQQKILKRRAKKHYRELIESKMTYS